MTSAAPLAVRGANGTDGLGGGGGGSANYWIAGTNYTSSGGDGGDGVVIVRYVSNWLSLSIGGSQQPSNYAYSPSTANWVSAAPKVQLIDAAGTALTTSGVSVTATFTATSGSATLSNVTATTDTNGVADFSSLVLNGNAGTAGALTFSATGFGAVTSTSVAIVKAQQAALTITSPSTVVYNDTISLTTSGGSGTGAVSYQIVGHTGTSRCSISPSTTLRGTAAGTGACQVLASKEADANFEQVISPIQLVTVTQATQLISFAPLPAKAYGDTSFSVSATTTSGLTVAFSSISASVCSIAGNTVTILAAGTCTIRASQAGNANVSAATPVDQSFTVSTRSITLTADNDTFTYGGSASPGFSVTSGALVGSDAILSATYSYAGTGSTTYPSSTTAPSNAGTYSVTPSAAVFSSGSASNYTINYVAGSLTISKTDQVIAFTSSPVGTDPNDTYTPTASVLSAYSGSASGLSATFVIASSSAGACTISAGTVTFVTRNSSCVIEATALGDNNFNAQTTAVTQTIVIGALNQTITFARPANVAFGSSSQQMSATASSGLTVTYNVDTSQLACDVAATGVVTIKAVGECAVTAVQAGNGQYAAASSVTQTFQVVAALPTAPTLTYASPASQSITAGFSAPGFTGGVSITGYSMVARVGGVAAASTTCASSPCTITGLVNGTNYTVTVAAINSAGTGPASTASGTMTPYTSAFAVRGLTPTPGDRVMDLTWAPLTNAQLGGGSFTRYEVSYRNPASTSTWTLATNALTTQTTSTYQVTGLTNGVSYDFQVVAFTTANATEVPGNTAQVVQYPSTVPSVPLSLSVLPVAGSSALTDVQFSWSAPLSDGGAALTNPNYSVTITGSAGAAPVTCTPPSDTATYCTASGLTNGASYTFSVVATNRMGNSPAATQVYNVPSADATLSDLVVTGTGGAVSLAPSFAAGTTSYTASVTNAVASATVTPTTSAAGASVTVDGVAVTSGSPSSAIALNVGSNVISVVVTAPDPSSTQTYTITITRQAASGGGGSGGSGGGSSAPTVPVMPPASVMNGGQVGGVLLGGLEETGVVWVRTSTNSGWEAVAPDFTLSVDTESRQRAPEPLLSNGAMQVPQGGFVVVNATGYAPQSTMAVFAIPRGEARVVGTVAARAMTNAISLGSATVDTSGNVGVTLSVPMTMDIGDYVLQINGESTQAQLRSVNLQLVVVAGTQSRTTKVLVQRAGFYADRSDQLSASGARKVRSLLAAIPRNAEEVRVEITGVSIGLDSFEENLAMAGKRATKMARTLKAAGITGEYVVNVSATFTVDAAERSSVSKVEPLMTKTGKPLTTVTVLYELPAEDT